MDWRRGEGCGGTYLGCCGRGLGCECDDDGVDGVGLFGEGGGGGGELGGCGVCCGGEGEEEGGEEYDGMHFVGCVVSGVEFDIGVRYYIGSFLSG